MDDPTLFQPTGKWRTAHDATITEQNAGERLFLRVERQTLRRLPDSGAVLFGIRVHVYPLADAVTTPEAPPAGRGGARPAGRDGALQEPADVSGRVAGMVGPAGMPDVRLRAWLARHLRFVHLFRRCWRHSRWRPFDVQRPISFQSDTSVRAPIRLVQAVRAVDPGPARG